MYIARWLLLAGLLPSAAGWMLQQLAQPRCSASGCASPHRFIPSPVGSADTPPAAAETVATSMPPDSFLELIQQAADATVAAISDGNMLLEIEFPPVPTSKLDDSSLSAYDILAANLQLALEFSKRVLPRSETVNQIALTLPDLPERKRAKEYLSDDEPAPGVRLWSLVGGAGEESPLDFLSSIFKQGTPAPEVAEWADMYLVLGSTCQELPTLRLLAEAAPTKPIVFFNLKLDTLRGDLGLPGFPPKAVHHEFLCRVMPVYYMRPRSYSLSLSVPPFLIAYSGVLFRRYPEGYQTLLDKGRTNYRRVNVETVRACRPLDLHARTFTLPPPLSLLKWSAPVAGAPQPRRLQGAADDRTQAGRRAGREVGYLAGGLQAVHVVGGRRQGP